MSYYRGFLRTCHLGGQHHQNHPDHSRLHHGGPDGKQTSQCRWRNYHHPPRGPQRSSTALRHQHPALIQRCNIRLSFQLCTFQFCILPILYPGNPTADRQQTIKI
ncbi:hypothetical protein RvY_17180-2 [Ramazzottius varieornatus]|uniref:Uncharacterized protein n=1 Tax=Ramazzottius varieornatus TaxID=947166 RepID=A0A1D1W8F6_RAMVA|nr:hypothetical protein RvY_17180-2 [Ramazzottius varieornatus]